jgi:hypothetical protein
MNSKTYTVKPCPFCGKQPKVYGDTVMCANQDCPARLMGELLIAVWNRRDDKFD